MDQIDIFRGYYRIIIISFVFVLLATVFLAYNQLQNRIIQEKDNIARQFQENISQLNSVLNVTQANLQSLNSISNYALDNPEVSHETHPLFSYLQDSPDRTFFHLDSLPNYLLSTQTSNITGLGSLKNLNPNLKAQVNMSFILNPMLRNTVNFSSNVVAAYYQGYDKGKPMFIALYPYVASKNFHFKESNSQNALLVYKNVLPEQNPSRFSYWTDVYVDGAGNGLMTTATIPVYSGDEFKGVIGLDVTLDSLNTIIQKSQLAVGEIFLMNNSEQLLAHPTLIKANSKEVKPAKEAFPNELKTSIKDLSSWPAETLNQNEGYFFYYQNLPQTPFKLVYVVNVWTTYFTILKDIGFYLVFMLVSIFSVLIASAYYTQRKFIVPAGKLVIHIQDEQRGEMVHYQGKVPYFWRPWFEAISEIFANNRKMIQELVEANENLEEKVQERTEEIAAQNEELIQNQEEILVQRGFIEQKVKELQLRDQQITNSIQSAFLIQNAILPYPEKLENLLHNCFVLYRPKDLVSGDFFWLNQVAGKTFLVVADCTGHGVPGAFMTLIGNTILDKIIRVWDIYDPALILERLHEDVRIMLRQEETGNNNGMDVGILCWDTESKGEEISFTYAGAKQGLYYIEPNSTTLKILKGVRKAIGGIQPKDIAFENDYFTVSKQTMIYLGSDGLPDQNDVNRKRFGDKRLQELFTKFHKSSVTKQGEILEEQLEKHMEDTTQRDDILVVGFRVS